MIARLLSLLSLFAACLTLAGCGDSNTNLGCETGQTACGGGCANLAKSFDNCGACGKACNAGEVCALGTCSSSCPAGFATCGGTCVDPNHDLDNCGAAAGGACNSTDSSAADYRGATCASGQVCAAGTCQANCLSSQVLCGGTCADPLSDRQFCGAALGGACNSADSTSPSYQGVKCSSGQVCAAGKCQSTCISSQALCAGICIDPLSDRRYCGAAAGGSCNSTDSASANYQGVKCPAGQVCADGKCQQSCLSTQILCGGQCVDPQSDNRYCGAALHGSCSSTNSTSADYQGALCSAGLICTSGSCQSSCGSGQLRCNGQCVDPLSDRRYCGAAMGGACSSTTSTSPDYQGALCGAGQVCASGTCQGSCLSDQVLCGTRCVDPQSDRQFCGAALGGTCNNASSSSSDYQGAVCSSGQVCSGASCRASCLIGQVQCGTRCVDPQFDQLNCGASGTCVGTTPGTNYAGVSCDSGKVCTGGSCQISCLAGQVLCGTRCVDPQSDRQFCGAALGGTCSSATPGTNYRGTTCPSGQVCAAGSCQASCLPNQVLCGTRCVDPQSDRQFCGAALGGTCNSATPGTNYQGTTCTSGQVCASGACQASCLANQVLCGTRCVDPATDPQFCGATLGGTCNSATTGANYKGATCAAGLRCTAGNCQPTCPADQAPCNGRCVETLWDSANCGKCGLACPSAHLCWLGTCTDAACPAGFTRTIMGCQKTYLLGGGALDNLVAFCANAHLMCSAAPYGFHWTDEPGPFTSIGAVEISFYQGRVCDSGARTVRLNGTTAGTYSSVQSCDCNNPTRAVKYFADGAHRSAYKLGALNRVTIEGSCAEGLSPNNSEWGTGIYAAVTVTY